MMNFLKKIPLKFSFYLLKELFQILLLSLSILTFILVLMGLSKITDFIINRVMEFKDLFLLLVLYIPPYLTFTFPMAFLICTIVVLGRLLTDNEILALKTNGVNLKWLFMPVCFLGVIIAICSLLNTNVLLPRCDHLLKETLINMVKKGISVDNGEGIFNNTIPDVTIYIDKVDRVKGILSGIFISNDRDRNVRQIITASKGFVHIDPDSLELYFILEDGNLHQSERLKDTYHTLRFQNYTFSVNLSPMISSAGITRRLPKQRGAGDLGRAIAKATDKAERYGLLLELYKTISLPLSTLAFVLLAVPLGVRKKAEGRVSGILYSILMFILYYILIMLAEGLGRKIYAPPIIVAFSPNIIILTIGLYLSRNLNKEEPGGTVSRHLKCLKLLTKKIN